jgi:hypothetical protein
MEAALPTASGKSRQSMFRNAIGFDFRRGDERGSGQVFFVPTQEVVGGQGFG